MEVSFEQQQEYLWYGKTQDDDLSDLGAHLVPVKSRPLFSFAARFFCGDALLIKGRLAETSEWGLPIPLAQH